MINLLGELTRELWAMLESWKKQWKPITLDKTDVVFDIISKWYLQGQMGQLDESQVNESTKEKVNHFLHSYVKVKSNLHVSDDGCMFWTMDEPFTLLHK